MSKDEKTYVVIFGNKTDLTNDRIELEKVKAEVIKKCPKVE